MAYFSHQSWQLLSKLEMYCGIGSCQNHFKIYIIRFTMIFILVSAIIPSLALWKSKLNLDICVMITIYAIVVGVLLTKLIMAYINEMKSIKIYEKVNDHFRRITDSEEAFVLNKSAKNSKKFCIKYVAFNITTAIVFFALPSAKMLLEMLFFHGEFVPILPIEADYGFLDQDKYYIFELLHIVIYGIAGTLANSACDYAFIIKVRHVRALFEVVEIRLQQASGFLQEYEWGMLDFKTANKKAYEVIMTAVDLHNEAFGMVSSIEETYSLCLIVILLQNTLVFSGGVYLILFNLDNPFHLFRYCVVFVALFIHFFVLFSQGQIIIDSSSSIFDTCYNIKWYFASTKIRRLLFIMMLRSFRPCEITGGGLFIISMETYSKMLQAGLSYFSVFTQ